jgi:hypothetical protein
MRTFREVVEKVIGDIEQAGATPYLAFRDGVVAGGASMRMSEGVAQLTGTAGRRHAGLEITAERVAPRFSSALYACGAGKAAAEVIRTVRSIMT